MGTLLFAGALAAYGRVVQERGLLEQVGWISGCWEMRNGARVVEEQRTAARGGTMVGMGRTVVRDSTVDYELTIVRQEGSRLVYEAHPAGQPSTVFRSIRIAPDSVVFEDPQHDFPQRV